MYIYRLTKGTINDDKHYIRFRHNKDGEYDENGEYDETYVKIGQSGSFVCTVNVSSTAEVFIGEPNPIFPSRMVWKKDEYGDRDVRPRQFGHDQTEIYRRAEVFECRGDNDDQNTGILQFQRAEYGRRQNAVYPTGPDEQHDGQGVFL